MMMQILRNKHRIDCGSSKGKILAALIGGVLLVAGLFFFTKPDARRVKTSPKISKTEFKRVQPQPEKQPTKSGFSGMNAPALYKDNKLSDEYKQRIREWDEEAANYSEKLTRIRQAHRKGQRDFRNFN